jgi:hypothetical protein
MEHDKVTLDYASPGTHGKPRRWARRISVGVAAVEGVAILVLLGVAVSHGSGGERGMAQGIAFRAVFGPTLLIGFLSAALAADSRSRLFALHGLLVVAAGVVASVTD